MQALHSISDAVVAGPRTIDPAKTFQGLVSWMRQLIIDRDVPGLMLGVSGTDSILAYLVCARAFESLGRGERVVGLHYGAPFPPENKTPDEVARIVSMSPSYRWVARSIVPWLQAQSKGALCSTDSSIDFNDDYQRWAALFRASLNGALRTEPLPPGENYWVVGTRNATEKALGSYSNVSGAVSVQPLQHLWKSEILTLCAWLGVPRQAIEKSRQVDCDCGRFDIAANNIEQVDWVLMQRQGLVSQEWLQRNVAESLLAQLESFVDNQVAYARFKKEIPYTPPASLIG